VLLFDPTTVPEEPWHESALQFVYQGFLTGALAPILYTRAIRTIGPQRAALVMIFVRCWRHRLSGACSTRCRIR